MASNQTFVTIGDCVIHSTARVQDGAIIGKPFRPLLENQATFPATRTAIGPDTYVGYYVLVGAGSSIGKGVILDDFSVVECDVNIGSDSLLIYRAQICNEARIGSGCVIGGFVAERVVVGDQSRVFGKIVHSQRDPTVPWDAPDAEEGSAVVKDRVFIGFNALVIGQVTIGPRVYICSGAIVTKDVPPGYIVSGVNKITPYTEWRGTLHESSFFRG